MMMRKIRKCTTEEEEVCLPEEMIDHIFTFLPVKSLLNFTLLSKRFRSLILYDSKFAKSQLHAARDRKTLAGHRLLYLTGPRFESLNLETRVMTTTPFGDPSSIREVKAPFMLPPPCCKYVYLLGSCNGIVFLALGHEDMYMWNPSNGFFKKLPQPYFISNWDLRCLLAYGVGYSPASDDYKLIGFYQYVIDETIHEELEQAFYYSSKADAWKPFNMIDAIPRNIATMQGTLFNDALHWITCENKILALDLEQQDNLHHNKLRNMLLPKSFDFDDDHHRDQIFGNVGVFDGDQQCLSLAGSKNDEPECIQVWIMREYGVRDSWTKLYNLKFSDPPKVVPYWHRRLRRDVVIRDSGMVITIPVDGKYLSPCNWLVNIALNEDETSLYKVEGPYDLTMTQYQESLIRVDH